MKDGENSKSEIEKQAEEVERVAFAKMLPPNSEDKGVKELDLKLTPEFEQTLKELKKIQESIENLFTAFRIPKDRI